MYPDINLAHSVLPARGSPQIIIFICAFTQLIRSAKISLVQYPFSIAFFSIIRCTIGVFLIQIVVPVCATEL